MADNSSIATVEATSILGHLQAEMAATAGTGAALRAGGWHGQWNLRGDPGDASFGAAVKAQTGVGLPAANRVHRAGDVAILWLGPDEWLITSAQETDLTAGMAALTQALGTQHFALTDVSDNRTVLDLSGPAAKQVIATGCGLDLRAWQVDHCAQSHFARAQILLWQVDEKPSFQIYVRNSFADYLIRFLLAEVSDL